MNSSKGRRGGKKQKNFRDEKTLSEEFGITKIERDDLQIREIKSFEEFSKLFDFVLEKAEQIINKKIC